MVVLSSVLLPRQISAVRDMKLFGKAHTMELSEEDIEIHMPTLSEKLELLGRAIQDPELRYTPPASSWMGLRPSGKEIPRRRCLPKPWNTCLNGTFSRRAFPRKV